MLWFMIFVVVDKHHIIQYTRINNIPLSRRGKSLMWKIALYVHVHKEFHTLSTIIHFPFPGHYNSKSDMVYSRFIKISAHCASEINCITAWDTWTVECIPNDIAKNTNLSVLAFRCGESLLWECLRIPVKAGSDLEQKCTIWLTRKDSNHKNVNK